MLSTVTLSAHINPLTISRMTLRNRCNPLSIWLLSALVLLLGMVSGWSQAQALEGPVPPVIELTRSDLFSQAGWDSTHVSILGVRVDMTRQETQKLLRAEGYHLEDSESTNHDCRSGLCQVCNSGGLCPGVDLAFDASNHVSSIMIERIPADALLSIQKAAIVKRFHGKTYSFFNDYSNALRQQLLGPESSLEADSQYSYIKTYRYDDRGIIVSVNPGRGVEKESDLSVTFTRLKSAVRQNR